MILNQKVHNLVSEGITPIVCFGETLEQRNSNQYLEHITNQINSAANKTQNKKLLLNSVLKKNDSSII